MGGVTSLTLELNMQGWMFTAVFVKDTEGKGTLWRWYVDFLMESIFSVLL